MNGDDPHTSLAANLTSIFKGQRHSQIDELFR